MRQPISFCFIAFTFLAYGQKSPSGLVADIEAFQRELDSSYADPGHSPLTPEDQALFEGLPYFDIDTSFYVVAYFERAGKPRTFKMKTTTDRRPKYDLYAYVHFTLKGKAFRIPVYQSHRLREKEEFRSYLFLPFNDLTNGEESYGGGRFLDLDIPEGDSIAIDFNKAYNPYCAYNSRYSCPVPPKANFIDVRITAGVKAPDNH